MYEYVMHIYTHMHTYFYIFCSFNKIELIYIYIYIHTLGSCQSILFFDHAITVAIIMCLLCSYQLPYKLNQIFVT